jgi:hypothetical protein
MTVQSFNIGGKPAEAVYLGDIKLWPAAAAGAIDPVTAKIVWGTEQVATLDLAGATVHLGPAPGFINIGTTPTPVPAEANLRIAPSADGNGLRIQADSFPYTVKATSGGIMGTSFDKSFAAYINIPATIAHLADVDDVRQFRGATTRSGTGWTFLNMPGDTPVPVLADGVKTVWNVQTTLVDGAAAFTDTFGIETAPKDWYGNPSVPQLIGPDKLRAFKPPVVRISLGIGGGAAATTTGTYNVAASPLDVTINPIIVCQMPVAP